MIIISDIEEKCADTIDKIKKLIGENKKVPFDELKALLRIDGRWFVDKMMEWAAIFKIDGDGNNVIINPNTVSEFTQAVIDFLIYRETRYTSGRFYNNC